MARLTRLSLAALCLLVLAPAAAPAQVLPGATAGPSRPRPGALYGDGPDGRFLLGGTWLRRLDPDQTGEALGFQRDTGTLGWTPVSVPDAWNARDDSIQSFAGGVAWYRRDFRLPDTHRGLAWTVRFESVNHRADAWLNGHPLGGHAGEFLPFELALRGLRRTGVNRLVVRVDSRHTAADFPPSRISDSGNAAGGWFNDGGLLREVYLRRVDRIDLQDVVVRPRLACPACPARVEQSARALNRSGHALRVRLTATFGSLHTDLGTRVVPAGGSAPFGAVSASIRHPRLWSPRHPHLYPATLLATVVRHGRPESRPAARYTLRSGVRLIQVTRDGRLLLDGEEVHLRGVGLHEDSPTLGMAIDSAFRRRLVAEVRSTGATAIRAHYPLHPQLLEMADRLGLLVWSEVPVYQVPPDQLALPAVRRAAVAEVADSIAVNQNHPSIFVWSIANELAPRVLDVQAQYISRAAHVARALDPTRPVGLAVAGYAETPCPQPGYGALDVLGFNEYFGWYTGPSGGIADRDLLSGYLDGLRRCYPHQVVMVTEFGAEANRPGPVQERGTFAFQQDFVRFQLGVLATKPWLGGAFYWALREFRVKPGWDGGNPRPTPPIHTKGLFTFDGRPKPALADLARIYRATRQYGPRRR